MRADKMLVRVSHGLGMHRVKVTSGGFHLSYTALNTQPINVVPDGIPPSSHRQLGNHCLRSLQPPGPLDATHRPGLGTGPTESILSERKKPGAERQTRDG